MTRILPADLVCLPPDSTGVVLRARQIARWDAMAEGSLATPTSQRLARAHCPTQRRKSSYNGGATDSGLSRH